VVHSVLAISPDEKHVFLLASEDGPAPYDRLLYTADLRGGRLGRISAEPGDHQVTFSPSGGFYTDAWSSIERPRRAAVRSIDGRSSVEYAAADVSRLAEIGYAPPERLNILAADGVTPLHGVLYKPADFDPARHYPVIDFVYGGPWLSIAPRGYGGFAGFATAMPVAANAMAQLGFIVVIVDGRGTPGRSKAFQDVIYGRIGQTEIPDQIAALKQAAATRPYMDLDRVGIYGHSWGGYFALRGMLTAPEFYKAGYAGAPGAFEEAAIINEPYLGLPAQNPQAYEAGSNPKLAANLRGALKLMHGTSDVNASLSSSMLMADALIRANKSFEQLIMPNQPHSVTPPFIRYYFEDQMRFFTRHLGGPR
jgi:dipeptidyl aminopeptidase/acylaminoacyl peptidase